MTPKWLTERRRLEAAAHRRCGRCGWQRHSATCPSQFGHLTSAEQIAEARSALMLWHERQRAVLMPRVDAAAADFATALTARAVEIGAETWDA